MSQPFNLPSHLGGSGVGTIPASLQTVVATASSKNAVSAFNSLDNFAKSMVTVAGLGGFLSIERIMADLVSSQIWAVPIKAAFAEMKSELVQSSVGIMKELFELVKSPEVQTGMDNIVRSLQTAMTVSENLLASYNQLEVKIPSVMAMQMQMGPALQTMFDNFAENIAQMYVMEAKGVNDISERFQYGFMLAIDGVLDALGIHIKAINDYLAGKDAELAAAMASQQVNEFGQHTGGR